MNIFLLSDDIDDFFYISSSTGFTSYESVKRRLSMHISAGEDIYTKDDRILDALSSMYSLSSFEEDGHRLFIVTNDGLRLIRDCTGKELRDAHNLRNMYIAGAFNWTAK